MFFTPKINTVPPVPLPYEKFPYLSNPTPYTGYLFWSILAFLVKLTAPNKQIFSVG